MSPPANPPRRAGALSLFFGMLVLGMLLVARAPAAFFAPRIEQLCQQRCLLAEVDGTLWQGRGSLFARAGTGETRPLLTLAWRFLPNELLRARAAWALRIQGHDSASISVDRQGIQLDKLTVQLPVSAIEPLLEGRLGARGWNGLAQLQAERWQCRWSGPACVGRLTVRWTDARVASLAATTLGDYRLDVGRDDGAATWMSRLKAERGPLWVDVSGTLGGGLFKISGPAWIDEPARRQLAPLLGAFAPYDSARERYNLNLALPVR